MIKDDMLDNLNKRIETLEAVIKKLVGALSQLAEMQKDYYKYSSELTRLYLKIGGADEK